MRRTFLNIFVHLYMCNKWGMTGSTERGANPLWRNFAPLRKLHPFNFDLWVGGDGLDMYQQLERGFGSMGAMLPIWGLGRKKGAKTLIWIKTHTLFIALKFITYLSILSVQTEVGLQAAASFFFESGKSQLSTSMRTTSWFLKVYHSIILKEPYTYYKQ